MDLRQLRYFTKLAEVLNFHRAAEQLNISQPPLTVAIRRLEEELGAVLFDRGPRGVRLTEAGMAALAPARAALAGAELVREAVRLGARGETGRLTVGFVGSAISERLPRIIPLFRQRFPLVELVLQEMTSVEIAQSLDARQLDVGLVRLPIMSRAPLDIQIVESDVLAAALPVGPSAWPAQVDRPWRTGGAAFHHQQSGQRAAHGRLPGLPEGRVSPADRAGGDAVANRAQPGPVRPGGSGGPRQNGSLRARRRGAVAAARCRRHRNGGCLPSRCRAPGAQFHHHRHRR